MTEMLTQSMMYVMPESFVVTNNKCNSGIVCLQKLRNTGIDAKILQPYYRCSRYCVGLLLTVLFIGWYGSLGDGIWKVSNVLFNVCISLEYGKSLFENDIRDERGQR